MFRTKFVEEIKTHYFVGYNIFYPENRNAYEIM